MKNRNVPFFVLAIVGMLVGPAVAAKPAADHPAPQTVAAWLQQEHVFFSRYRAVLRRTAHDYKGQYPTSPILMPVLTDLFTGCVAHIHAMEEQFLYPAIEPHMTPEQQQWLELMLHDQHLESGPVRKWSELFAAHEPGTDFTRLAKMVDRTGQMVNRHIVLQERNLFPVLDDLLTPEEQASILTGVAGYEQEVFGPTGREQCERLLSYLEEEFRAINGRI